MNIFEIFGIDEAYQLTDKLAEILFNREARGRVFAEYISTKPDLSRETFLEEFQSVHADRGRLNQDFTPPAVADLVSLLAGSGNRVLDVCAGTGSLTITQWAQNPHARIECEEYSRPALMLLLFNLAVRNADAVVRHTDVLTREVFAAYRITPGEQFGDIELLGNMPDSRQVDVVVSNPPYSAKWQPQDDDRFEGFGLAPKSKADYAFVLHGLHRLADNGTMVAVLPHGVLFRGAAEAAIRQKLIEQNHLHAVIGLPENLFQATSIPVCLMVLKKNRTTRDVLFIDASDGFAKAKNVNLLQAGHIDNIMRAYRAFADAERFAKVVTPAELAENDFNLNIPRYVDTFVREPVQDLNDIMDGLLLNQRDIDNTNRELLAQMRQLKCSDPAEQADFDRAVKKFAVFAAPPAPVASGSLLPPDVDGMIAQTEQQIAQLQAMKQYFLDKMFV